jgi:hypothetical protein
MRMINLTTVNLALLLSLERARLARAKTTSTLLRMTPVDQVVAADELKFLQFIKRSP